MGRAVPARAGLVRWVAGRVRVPRSASRTARAARRGARSTGRGRGTARGRPGRGARAPARPAGAATGRRASSTSPARRAGAATTRACGGRARAAPGRGRRKRTIRSSGGMRACRRRRTSPSIAVHSTSNRSADAAALVPDAVDRLAVLLRDERHRREPRLALPMRIEEVAERPVADPARLVALAEPDAHPELVAAVREEREQLRVLGGPAPEVLVGHEPARGRGRAAVAREAGPDERLVGQVVAGEEGRHALEERGLGDRAGGRQEAVDGPLDAIGERDRGRLAVRSIAEPPATGLDLLDAVLVGSRRARPRPARGPARRGRARPAAGRTSGCA